MMLMLLVCGSSSRAQAQFNPAVTPADRLSEAWWAARHGQVISQVKQHPESPLLLIGDSITNNYDKSHPPDENFEPTWREFYGCRGALNLGFSGDATEHVLWRLEHGEVEGLHPKAALLLVGTNNTGHENQTAEQTEVGIDAVVADLERLLPNTHILLIGILPSGVSAEKTERDREVNRYLANNYGENSRVTYLDIGAIFFKGADLNVSIYYDPRLPQHGKPLHPDTLGQRMMAEAIEPTLAKLMGEAPRVPLTAMTDVNTAVIPVDWLEQDSYDWYARHHAELKAGRDLQPQIAMIGDSITHFWGGRPIAIHANGPIAWERTFGEFPVLNMGFGWDRTQNVLWRLRQGELDGLAPKWVVIEIGTNNLTGSAHARANTPAETAAGVDAIVKEVRKRSPRSRIIVMGIFPRGKAPDNPLRSSIAETNRLLANRFAADSGVMWLDIGKEFLQADKTLPLSVMPDGTHPSELGYGIWADSLEKAGIGK